MKNLLLLLSVSTLAGCLVYPSKHEYPTEFGVTGLVLRDGQPVQGVQLTANSLYERSACEQPTQVVTTGDDGRFSFKSRTETARFKVVPLAPSAPTYFLSVCTNDDEPLPVYVAEIWAILPDAIDLRCDLSTQLDGENVCSATITGRNHIRGHNDNDILRELRQREAEQH